MENRELFDKVIRNDIDLLENDKQKIKKKIDKITGNFNCNDIQKLNSHVIEFDKIQAIQTHLYMVLGSLGERIKKVE